VPTFNNMKDLEKFLKSDEVVNYAQGTIKMKCPACEEEHEIKVKGKKGICTNCNAEINIEYDIIND